MKKNLATQLIAARKQAKTQGVRAYGRDVKLSLYPDFALIENSYKFRLEGLESPYPDGVLVYFRHLLWVLQIAEKITSDYKIDWVLPYAILISGKTSKQKFSVKLPLWGPLKIG